MRPLGAIRWGFCLATALVLVSSLPACRKRTDQSAKPAGSKESGQNAADGTAQGTPQTDKEVVEIHAPDYDAHDIAKILALRDLALARLEAGPLRVESNGRKVSSVELAQELFAQLQELAPHERLPIQDRTVAAVFSFLQTDAQQASSQRPSVLGVTGSFLKQYPGNADAALLHTAALLHQVPVSEKSTLEFQAIDTLVQATKGSPNDGRLWFRLYEIVHNSKSPSHQQLAAQAIRKCHELAPNNIAVLRRWLLYLANHQPADLPDEIKQARQLLEPIALRVQSQTGLAVSDLLDRALAKPEQALAPLYGVDNVIKKDEIQKRDFSRIQPNPMDLVIYRFDDARLQALPVQPVAEAGKLGLSNQPRQLISASDVRQLMVEDFNQDGRRDLWVLQDDKLTIFSPKPGSQEWEPITTANVPSGARGFLIGDLDRDKNFDIQLTSEKSPPPENPREVVCVRADLDVVVYGSFGVRVFRQDHGNDGSRSLAPVDQTTPLGAVQDVHHAVFADLDMDYDLDLVLSTGERTSLWLSIGGFRFVECSQFSLLPESPLVAMIPVDLDRDADLDIVGIDANGQVGYLENMLHLRFRWGPLGVGFPDCDDARDVALVEANGDASWDVVVARKEQTELWLTATTPGQFRFVESVASKGTADQLYAEDWNNDGLVDLLGLGNATVLALQGNGRHGFQPWANRDSSTIPGGSVSDAADIDHDGDLDLILALDSKIVQLENATPAEAHWLEVSLRGGDDNAGRVNRNGFGSLVEVKTDKGYQARIANRPTVHFGLGSVPQVNILRVLWTNGMPQSRVQLKGSVVLCEPFELKGSCPFVYPWNGKEFAFYTDCLWAAPLGLQVDDGIVAPCREWEYLRIPGELLKPKDGGYELLLTEELWEAAYFDHVELLAVDHPPDVEVYSNEKVGPAEIAEFQVHVVREKRWPARALDSEGRDCRELLREADGRFVQAFPRAIRRGLAPLHYIELDLGSLPDNEPVKLFLTGWIFPTDTSLNLAYAQEPELGGPVLPYVEVVDDRGQWQTVIPYMGFPGGKTKTIVVDLTGKFLSDDRRVRVTTSAEIYWDRAFFTVGDQNAEVTVTRLPLESSSLYYRGFSQPLPTPRHAPRRFDGSKVSTEPKWVAMRGRFTRYGDVLPLLKEADNEMVVMGAGDALRCRFPFAPPAPGTKRDFLLYSVGWDKDADLNTLLGQNSEPLPYREMGAYPHGLLSDGKDGPTRSPLTYRYLTRRQDWGGFWKRLARPEP